MTGDDPKHKQTDDKQEITGDREEQEYRRDDQENKSVSGNTTEIDNTLASPDKLESGGEAIQGKDEKQIDVPQITIELDSKLNSTDLIKELPAGAKSVQIPQIQTQPTLRLKTGDITETILTRSEAGLPSVPQFSQNTADRLSPVEFEDNKLDEVNRVQKVQVLQMKIGTRHRIRPFSTFLETIPEITPKDKDVEEGAAELEEQEVVEATQVIEGEADSMDEAEAGTKWIEGDWPDPLELLFGSGGTDIKSGSPLVIKMDGDGLVGAVETLVKRRYREIEGGEPDLKKFNTAYQLANEERWMSADSQIFTAQLLDEEWKKLEENYQEEWQSIWNNKMDQLFSGQRFGAIIFNRINLPRPEVMSLPHHPPTQAELENVVDWKDIVRVFWTGLDQVEPRKARTFSQVFDWDTNGVAKDRRLQTLQALDGKFNFAANGDDEASDEHYALKLFVVKWLVEELWEADKEFSTYDDLSGIDYREIEKTILTERPLSTDDNPMRPDVRYGSQVFEVEMFFGESDENGVVAKLQDTVRKYEEVNDQIDTINVVLDNLTCLLHLKDLAQFKRNHKTWEEDYADVNLYTLDLGQEGLVPVGDVINNITSL